MMGRRQSPNEHKFEKTTLEEKLGNGTEKSVTSPLYDFEYSLISTRCAKGILHSNTAVISGSVSFKSSTNVFVTGCSKLKFEKHFE